jgi:hypothetical protein
MIDTLYRIYPLSCWVHGDDVYEVSRTKVVVYHDTGHSPFGYRRTEFQCGRSGRCLEYLFKMLQGIGLKDYTSPTVGLAVLDGGGYSIESFEGSSYNCLWVEEWQYRTWKYRYLLATIHDVIQQADHAVTWADRER